MNNKDSILFLGDVVPYKPFKFRNTNKTIINLECPIAKDGNPVSEKVILRVKQNYLPNIFNTNLLCASLGNNHILDFGRRGLESTLSELKELDVKWFGINEGPDDNFHPLIIDFNSHKIALISVVCNSTSPVVGLDSGTQLSILNIDKLIDKVSEIRKSIQRIIVYIHWGIEESSYPSKEDILIARKLIEAGVDIIIGSHAHAPQPIEKYKDGIIAYNLGNFIMPELKNMPAYFDEKGVSQSAISKNLMLLNRISCGLIVDLSNMDYQIKRYIFLFNRILELPFTHLDKYLTLKQDSIDESYELIMREHLKKRAFKRKVRYYFSKPYVPEKIKRILWK